MKTFKILLLLSVCLSNISAYSPETTSFEHMHKGWQSEKAFIIQHDEIFERHCEIWGVSFSDFLDIVVNECKSNFYPLPWLKDCIKESPNHLRPYTQKERNALLAYEAAYQECAMLAIDDLEYYHQIALKKEKFEQSMFSAAFGAVWAQVMSGRVNPSSALIGACIGVTYEYAKDYAIQKIWNPEPELKQIRMLCAKAEKAEEHLLINLRPIID